MTQEDKELLLVVLCTMLPYGVICLTDEYGKIHKLKGINKHKGIWWYEFDGFRNIKPPKPYLRPMSSMTEKEKEELKEIGSEYLAKWENAQDSIDKWRLDAEVSYKRSEFYNYHLLDWRGLIPKGLALEAPEGMYNLNK